MKQHHIYLALLAAFLALGAASVGPWAPSPFTARTGTNTTAAAWRTALGASGTSGGSLTNTALVGGSATGLTNTDLTASRVVVSSASKVLASSTVTTTELAHLSGVTGGVQTNIDARVSSAVLAGYVTNLAGNATNAALVGGTVTSQTNLDLTASRVMVSDANKVPASSSVTTATLAFLDATSSVQTQLDAKASAANLTTVSNAQIATAANLLSVSNAQIATAANLLTASNAQVTTDGKLAGYVTNLGGLATNLGVSGLTNFDLTASTVPYSDANKKLTSSAVTPTELGYLSGVTGGLQTNIAARIPSASGSATNLSVVGLTVTGQTNTDLTASRIVVTDGDKKLASSSATATEAGYLSGVTSAIQTQLDSKPTVALTNVARLNQSQTFTATNTFNTNTVLGTNRVGDFLGEGGRWRRLYIHPATNWNPTAGSAETNLLFSFTLPPLMSEHSEVKWRTLVWRTNVTAQPAFSLEFRANSTNGPVINGASSSVFLPAANYGITPFRPAGGSMYESMLSNCGSFTRQMCFGTNYAVTAPLFDLGWDTTQSTNTINVMLIQTSAAGTNRVDFEFFEFLERY